MILIYQEEIEEILINHRLRFLEKKSSENKESSCQSGSQYEAYFCNILKVKNNLKWFLL